MRFNRRRFMQGSALAGGTALAACATANVGAAHVDPMFSQPFIDVDEWRDTPTRHRYVHGGFTGTDARFVFYFPPAERYQGRFFQYISPVPVPEDRVYSEFGNNDPLGFGFASGAYVVGSNQGGAGATGVPGSGVDPTLAAFRASAASAEYSRVVAREMYGGRRPYGYVYGGSGGAFRTIGCVENTNAWDGSVPFVMGSPMAIPNVYTVRCHALRILKNKFPQIIDALEPGGSGDIYAGLNEEESGALTELLKMGFPKQSLVFAQQMGIGAFAILFDIMQFADASYFTDFWTVPGYLGANPPPSLVAARVQHRTRVVRPIMSTEAASVGLHAPWMGGGILSDVEAWQNIQNQVAGGAPFVAALEVRQAPPSRGDLTRAAVRVHSGASSGRTFSTNGVDRNFVLLNFSPIGGAAGAPAQVQVAAGDEIEIDNSNYLAAQTYHRHQVPGPDYPVWDQFRNPDGTPKYPQRPRLLGPGFQQSAAGTLPTAQFNGKMIVVETLMDYDAFPWQADWYRKKVEANLGERTESRYRLWMIERAVHGGPNTLQTISYDNVLQQALRDVSAWVERGVAPPQTSEYRVDDGQVFVPDTAAARHGIQPTVRLTANGAAQADVRAGQAVTFSVTAETPPGTGSIVEARWDFEGENTFAETSEVAPAPNITLTKSHTFARPGTYFVVVRVASQRQADQATPYAKIYNLARARVVVT